jgi:hypothetical protein
MPDVLSRIDRRGRSGHRCREQRCHDMHGVCGWAKQYGLHNCVYALYGWSVRYIWERHVPDVLSWSVQRYIWKQHMPDVLIRIDRRGRSGHRCREQRRHGMHGVCGWTEQYGLHNCVFALYGWSIRCYIWQRHVPDVLSRIARRGRSGHRCREQRRHDMHGVSSGVLLSCSLKLRRRRMCGMQRRVHHTECARFRSRFVGRNVMHTLPYWHVLTVTGSGMRRWLRRWLLYTRRTDLFRVRERKTDKRIQQYAR